MATSSKASAIVSPSPTAVRRLGRDLQKLKDEPIEGIEAQPLEENILEWHYLIRGTKGTPFEGGFYHGKLVFPSEFPWKPPSIYMFTPNGRFLPNQRLCLSISDYHPETWNPGWTVSAILVGLHSFMNESSIATGTETTTPQRKKELAAKSASYNLRDATFCKLFPEVVAEVTAAGIEKMSDAQAQEETGRTLPRYARGPMANGNDDFIQNARQHMMNMQNEMEAAMRAAMRDVNPVQYANPILPDDIYFGVAGAGNVVMQNQQQPMQMMRPVGGAGGLPMGGAAPGGMPPPPGGPGARPYGIYYGAGMQGPNDPAMGNLFAARPPPVAVIPAYNPAQQAHQAHLEAVQLRVQQQEQRLQMLQQQAAAAVAQQAQRDAQAAADAAAGPLNPQPVAAGDEDGPPPAKRTPDVVTLD